eukprot:5241436-Pyramimonas_sp.AAC.1
MFLAVSNVLFSILPISTWAFFIPSSFRCPGSRHTDAQSGLPCVWDEKSSCSGWCVPGELVNFGASSIWILVCCMDEGQ